MRTALSVVLTLWPPAPRDLNVSMRRSFGSMWTSNYERKTHKNKDLKEFNGAKKAQSDEKARVECTSTG